jgi:hypothetical protein
MKKEICQWCGVELLQKEIAWCEQKKFLHVCFKCQPEVNNRLKECNSLFQKLNRS